MTLEKEWSGPYEILKIRSITSGDEQHMSQYTVNIYLIKTKTKQIFELNWMSSKASLIISFSIGKQLKQLCLCTSLFNLWHVRAIWTNSDSENLRDGSAAGAQSQD